MPTTNVETGVYRTLMSQDTGQRGVPPDTNVLVSVSAVTEEVTEGENIEVTFDRIGAANTSCAVNWRVINPGTSVAVEAAVAPAATAEVGATAAAPGVVEVWPMAIATANPADVINMTTTFNEQIDGAYQRNPDGSRPQPTAANGLCANPVNAVAGKIYDFRGCDGVQHDQRSYEYQYTMFEAQTAGAGSFICGGKVHTNNTDWIGDVWAEIHGKDKTGFNAPGIWISDSNAIWQGFYLKNTMDGIQPRAEGWEVQNIKIISRDDCVENDDQYSGAIRNGFLQGHTLLSVRPGTGSRTESNMRSVVTFENCLVWLKRQPYDGDEKAHSGATGADYGDRASQMKKAYTNPTDSTRHDLIASGSVDTVDWFAHKSCFKSSVYDETNHLYFARVHMKNCLIRVDTMAVEGADRTYFPGEGDGSIIPGGGHNGSKYENVTLIVLAPGGWNTISSVQTKAQLPAGITVIEDETTGYQLWNDTVAAWEAANEYQASDDSYAWTRPGSIEPPPPPDKIMPGILEPLTGLATFDPFVMQLSQSFTTALHSSNVLPPVGWESFTPLNVSAGGTFVLRNDTDYLIANQASPLSVRLRGGRKVVIMGLTVTITRTDWTTVGSSLTCGIYLDENPSILPADGGPPQAGRLFHCEGMLFQGATLTQGVLMSCPTADVHIVNIHCKAIKFDNCDHRDGTNGKTSNHPDLIQPSGGVKSLIIDGFTGYSAYQGIFLKEDTSPQNGSCSMRRVDVHAVEHLGSDGISYPGNRMIYLENPGMTITTDTGSVWCDGVPRNGKQGVVFYRERYWNGSAYVLEPAPAIATDIDAIDPTPDPGGTDALGNYGIGQSGVSGRIYFGSPLSEFVPASAVGQNYVYSPTGDRIVSIELRDALGCTIKPNQSTAHITIIDLQPVIVSIAAQATSIVEGGTGVTKTIRFTVTKDPGTAVDSSCSIQWQRSGTLADSDLVNPASVGTVTFSHLELNKNIDFVLNGDSVFESDEDIRITLVASTAINCSVGIATAVTVVLNDDSGTSDFVHVYEMEVEKNPHNKTILRPTIARTTGNAFNIAANTIIDLRGQFALLHENSTSATSFTINGAAASSVICGGRATSNNKDYFGTVEGASWAKIHGDESTGKGASGNYPAIRVSNFTKGFKMQGFYCRRTMDGISANDFYNTKFDEFIFEDGCFIEMRDDAISNDGQGAAIYRNVFFQGHVWLSWAPGDPGAPGPPGGSPDPKRGTINTFENCFIDMDRMMWIGEDTSGQQGGRRVNKYFSPTNRNNGIVNSGPGMGHQHPIKGPAGFGYDPGGRAARIIMRNSIMRISTPPVDRFDDPIFPVPADGVGPGSVSGSLYDNFHVCWLGPARNSSGGVGPWPWSQSPAQLKDMGITFHDGSVDEQATHKFWEDNKAAWFAANGYDVVTDTFSWNRR